MRKDITPWINGWALKFKTTRKILLILNLDERYQINYLNTFNIHQKTPFNKIQIPNHSLKWWIWNKYVKNTQKTRKKGIMFKIMLLFGSFLQDKIHKMRWTEETLRVKSNSLLRLKNIKNKLTLIKEKMNF